MNASLKPWSWILLSGLLGFGSAYWFTAQLHWSRERFVLAHGVLVLVLIVAYSRIESVSLSRQVARRWKAGALGGLLVGALLVRQVLSQPPSARPGGTTLAVALSWLGAFYGTVDALLLSILPVLTVYGSRTPSALASGATRLRVGLQALAASAVVTAVYHLGFAEFRGPQVVAPVIGSSLITLAYLLTGSPIAAVVAHVLMHIASVLHGMATTVQLPPHY